jgi:hypothetical protein
MKDITVLIFTNLFWLLVGFLLYYVLTGFKVFLLIRMQPLTFVPDSMTITLRNVLAAYCRKIFTDRLLHRNILSYMAGRGTKETWKLIGIKKINIYFSIIDALTTLLKPYLIIAVLWAILKALIDSKCRYDQIKITLGQIQILLSNINENEIFNHFNENKDWYYIGILVLLLIFSVSQIWEKRIEKLKKNIFIGFTIASVLFGLTFFGADLGAVQKKYKQDLVDLRLDINKIHGNIYGKVATAIISHDLKEIVANKVINNEKEVTRMDSVIQNVYKYFPAKKTPFSLTERLKQQRNIFAESVSIKSPKTHADVDESIYLKFYENNNNSTPNALTKKVDYCNNPDLWNKERGLKYAEAIQDLDPYDYRLSAESNAKLSEIAEESTKALVSKMVNTMSGLLGFEDIKLGNAVLEGIIFEGTKTILSKLKKCFANIGNVRQSIRSFSYSCFSNQKPEVDKPALVSEIHMIETEKIIQEEFEVAMKTKAANLVEQKIEEILKQFLIVDSTTPYSDDYVFYGENLKNDYIASLNLSNTSKEDFVKLLTLEHLTDEIAIRLMTSTRNRTTHPGPIETCPICAYLNFHGIRGNKAIDY